MFSNLSNILSASCVQTASVQLSFFCSCAHNIFSGLVCLFCSFHHIKSIYKEAMQQRPTQVSDDNTHNTIALQLVEVPGQQCRLLHDCQKVKKLLILIQKLKASTLRVLKWALSISCTLALMRTECNTPALCATPRLARYTREGAVGHGVSPRLSWEITCQTWPVRRVNGPV